MKYFLDTEFIEGFHEPLFGKRRHFIDLISIGMVCEDGRTYQAISNEYKYNDADEWVKENVILPLYQNTVSGFGKEHCSPNNFQLAYGKSNKEIAEDIIKFVNPCSGEGTLNYKSWNDHLNEFKVIAAENRPIEFYGYYADYDWVLFCSLFGRMIDLPKGFPMYCRDLKQMYDEKEYSLNEVSKKDNIVWNLKDSEDYPKQENEHNALADAKWNKKLYEFINLI